MGLRDQIKTRYSSKRYACAADVLRKANEGRNGDAMHIPDELEELYVQSMSQKEHTDLLAAHRDDVGRMQAALIAANVLNEKHKRLWIPESEEDIDEILALDSVFTTSLYLAVDKHSEQLTEETVKN